MGAPELDLRSHEEVRLHDDQRDKTDDFEPTEEEMREVRAVIDAYDRQLYDAVPSNGRVFSVVP